MAKAFEFRPNTALSDTAFYAYGKTPEELIVHACQAVTEAMVDRQSVEGRQTVEIKKEGGDLEQLLYAVLEEVIYQKDANRLVFRDFKVTDIQSSSPPMTITMTMKGEPVDHEKHGSHADVKAVTYHQFEIEELVDGLRASVVLDV